MCGIILSFDALQFEQLAQLNASRGSFSHSLTIVENDYTTHTVRNFGPFKHFPKNREGKCMIGHVQAPTGGLVRDPQRIHPAQMDSLKLWHNGIIKNSYVRKINERCGAPDPRHSKVYTWDTEAFLASIYYEKAYALTNTDGSFACVLVNERDSIEVFRNQTSPLYYTMAPPGLAISSVSFPMSLPLKANTLFRVDISKKELVEVYTFKNVNTPYYFGE